MTPDDLMDLDDLAAFLRVKPSTVRSMLSQPERHRRIDGLPAPLRRVGNAPVWERAAIEAWATESAAP